MKKLYVSIDRKYKTDGVIKEQTEKAVAEAEKEAKGKLTVVDSVEKADCAWFVDEWEDDVDCYKEHEYCLENGIQILHDKSEFWNQVVT